MMFERQGILKSLTPRMIQRSVQSFDRNTGIVVSSFWVAALVAILLALYSLTLVAGAKKDIATAEVLEPSLPKMVVSPVEIGEVKTIVDRMQRLYPELTWTQATDASLTISANEGSRFRAWLTALSYIDTISPQYRWEIRDLCVGTKCPNSMTVMKAVLIAKKITYTKP